MAVTPGILQYTESNLIGYLQSGLADDALTAYVLFYDKVTGAARIPSSDTKLFVIDKGSPNQPNPQYEIVYCTSHSTTNGVTTLTIASNGRNLLFTGHSLVGSATGNTHIANAEVGTVDVHYYYNLMAATLKGDGDMIVFPTFADYAALVATVVSPVNGMFAFLVNPGKSVQYIGGAWIDTGTGATFINATESAGGKIQLATVAQQGASTAVDPGTFVPLVPQNKNLILHSTSGPSIGSDTDKYKIPMLNLFSNLDEFISTPVVQGGTASGASGVYSIITSPTYLVSVGTGGYYYGLTIAFIASSISPAGGCTLNVNALGAKTIKKWRQNGTAYGVNWKNDIGKNDIQENQPVLVWYDGTNFILMSNTPSVSSVYITNTRSLTDASAIVNIAHELGIRPSRLDFYFNGGVLVGTSSYSYVCSGHHYGIGTGGGVWTRIQNDGVKTKIVYSSTPFGGIDFTVYNATGTDYLEQHLDITMNATNIILTWTKNSQGSPTSTGSIGGFFVAYT